MVKVVSTIQKKVRVLSVGEIDIPYTLRKRKGQRNMALSVHEGGRVTVTVPRWVTLGAVEVFLRERHTWLMEAIEKLAPYKKTNSKDTEAHYQKHKEAARSLVKVRLATLNQRYGFSYGRISIRKNSSRWGSCSAIGNLNFDYRILFLPPAVQDYLLVHELCHLREMNHSPRFWALVEKEIPNHKEHRKVLRGHNIT